MQEPPELLPTTAIADEPPRPPPSGPLPQGEGEKRTATHSSPPLAGGVGGGVGRGMDRPVEIILTDAPGERAEAIIDEGLSEYNREQAGYADARPLAVLMRDPDSGEVLGGLLGRTTLGLFFIDLIHLPAAARGHGLGGQVLAMAEQEAIRRGCTAATLFTIHFQAPGFYARHGWREVGRIECDPPGHTRICMSKRLVPA